MSKFYYIENIKKKSPEDLEMYLNSPNYNLSPDTVKYIKDILKVVKNKDFTSKIELMSEEELYNIVVSKGNYDFNISKKNYKIALKKYNELKKYNKSIIRAKSKNIKTEYERTLLSLSEIENNLLTTVPTSSSMYVQGNRNDIPVFHIYEGEKIISFIHHKPELPLEYDTEIIKLGEFGNVGILMNNLSQHEIIQYKSAKKKKKDFTDEQKIELYKRMKKYL